MHMSLLIKFGTGNVFRQQKILMTTNYNYQVLQSPCCRIQNDYITMIPLLLFGNLNCAMPTDKTCVVIDVLNMCALLLNAFCCHNAEPAFKPCC